MTVLTACSHCGAILDDSPFCAICQKSSLEPVEELALEPVGSSPHSGSRLPVLVAAAGILAVLALIWAWSRPGPAPTVAPQLPTPTTLDPAFSSDQPAPSVADGPPTAAPAAGSVTSGSVITDDGLAPWDTPRPGGLFTAEELLNADFGPSMARLAALLDAVPAPWSIAPASDDIADLPIDIDETEATRPFAARSLTHAALGPIGQLWIVSADPDHPPGVAYVQLVREFEDDVTIVETVDAGPDLELVRIESERFDIWVASDESPTLIMFFVRQGTDPSVLLTFLEDWRLADLQLS